MRSWSWPFRLSVVLVLIISSVKLWMPIKLHFDTLEEREDALPRMRAMRPVFPRHSSIIDQSLATLDKVFPKRHHPFDPTPRISHSPAKCEGQDFVLVFKNRVYGFQERAEQRQYQSTGKYLGGSVYFVIGRLPEQERDPEKEERLKNEIKKYDDIIVGDFKDVYGNLRAKELVRYKWFMEHCNTPSVFFIDDDLYPNLVENLHFLKSLERGEEVVSCIGPLWDQSKPFRDPESRHYTPYEYYGLDYYPPFCSGSGYALGASAVRKIFVEMLNRSFVPFGNGEDWHATGVFRVYANVPIQRYRDIVTGHRDLDKGDVAF